MENKKYNKYEKARLIGARSLQIAHGAIPLVETNLKDPMDIALLELENNLCPIDIRNLKEITN
ncbi:MAG: DNA-directed RNA polymerase subunit K [Candidatus Aenigmatarchaeota archaeon]